jgi:osmotically-inducible protein OsmY
VKRFLLGVLLAACGCGAPEGPRTEEERVDDHAIAADVNRALSRIDGIDRLRVKIDCARGTVVLSGPVRDDAAARAACRAAEDVKGVKEVLDRLDRTGR